MRDTDHVREIDRVLRGQTTGRDGVVSESWRRCVETYGMDPSRPSPAHIVTEAELRAHREQSERLIAIARSGLDSLFRQVAGQNYVLLLADAKGVTVDFFGDRRFEDDLRTAGLYMGSDWSENRAGTCGVGSCIVTGEAITIHQTDHFDLHHTPLSCTAAPIFDTSGNLSAVLDLSLLRSPQPKASQNLAMNLVCSSARRVEMANLMAMTRRDWVLRFSASPEFLEVDPEAAIALDDSGRVIGLTHAAQQVLGSQSGSLLGRRLDQVMELSVDDLPELMRGRPTEERVIRLHDGRALFGHAIAPQTARVPRQTGIALPGGLSSIAGPDPAMQALLTRAAKLARTQIPLLLSGETGTGKHRLARAIHMCETDARPFIQLDCARADPAAIDAMLPSAGTPGTLFMQGVDDLSPAGQAAILRLLTDAKLRVIASVRDDLSAMTRSGAFRGDLFFRIAGATLSVPPLRLRQDFDWLLDRLLRQRNPDGLRLTPAARSELKARSWPGNLRELGNTLDVAVSLAEGADIDITDLPDPVLVETRADDAECLESLLDACGWNMAQTARRLGVNRSTILRRVQRLGLTPPQ
ncbi:sigma-54-dependent Fis family transcriptional regulator [Paracoccus saliphilus]|uniref:Sigma-54-dependent Fis family transcriptional regulator n=1 Tax=Paracoccus saliphilus TaxID=405559 RepID=A0AA46A7T9_9RHOB|nr:sigma-54-dependent Fis family transcriptional regulator [Paracoccus saliphilus]WCR02681.1 sigma-54-dependent Fis family transcriptional regulator [Paracoccus saliphilus]SIT18402.1 Transcriptional regulator of acetoin/glycerol metabolism [Paracoccus saliphilus]